MRIQLLASHWSHACRVATLGILLSILVLRMEGTTRMAGVLYFCALTAYLLVRWRVSPWRLVSNTEPRLDRSKTLALNSTHYIIFGMLLGALVVMITANEMRRFAPEYTVERLANGYKTGAYPNPLFTLEVPQRYKPASQLLVIGKVEQQVVLLELSKVIEDVARDGLNELATITLALFLLPCIGIFALKLLESVALL